LVTAGWAIAEAASAVSLTVFTGKKIHAKAGSLFRSLPNMRKRDQRGDAHVRLLNLLARVPILKMQEQTDQREYQHD
jgi:hypothetical protein